MKGFHHPNVLSLHGVVIKDYIPLVVLEYMNKGDLKSYLVKNKQEQVGVTNEARRRICPVAVCDLKREKSSLAHSL